jgi:hypothetical protein
MQFCVHQLTACWLSAAVRWPTRALQQEEEEEAVAGAEQSLLPPELKVFVSHTHTHTHTHTLLRTCCDLAADCHQVVTHIAWLRVFVCSGARMELNKPTQSYW